MIYHITTIKEWEKAKELGEYSAPSLISEGFIHCSLATQVTATAGRYFCGSRDLIVLEMEPEKLDVDVKYELAPIGETFPHVYGPIPVEKITACYELKEISTGQFWWSLGGEPI